MEFSVRGTEMGIETIVSWLARVSSREGRDEMFQREVVGFDR